VKTVVEKVQDMLNELDEYSKELAKQKPKRKRKRVDKYKINVDYKFHNYYNGYENYDNLKDDLLYKRIVKWDNNKLQLDDGTILSVVETEQDCCAKAFGKFTDVEFDAVITDVSEPIVVNIPDDDTVKKAAKVVIYHNQNPIAQTECYADAGNGGYYYSICSFVVTKDDNEKLYKIVAA
jgi:hypothetical protein